MAELISIIYAHRNRDSERIKVSLDSLSCQSDKNFEVIFIDYGSESRLEQELKELCEEYEFANYYHLPVQQLLWNKSKALNYGILQSNGEYIFIGDVDLVFHPDAVKLMFQNRHPQQFQLFTLSYLNKKQSDLLKSDFAFEQLKPSRTGDVNGMILVSKNALLQINGFDEFFHFYGAEDVDLFSRLEHAGFKETKIEKRYFLHNAHPTFQGSEDEIITANPRIKNIMRINEQHYLHNKKLKITCPLRQSGMGNIISKEESERLNTPTISYRINNIAARVDHFLEEELPTLKNEIIKVEFVEDPYYNSAKYKLKMKLGRQTQPYYSLKEVNDRVLRKILFSFRDINYSFRISEALNALEFRLEV